MSDSPNSLGPAPAPTLQDYQSIAHGLGEVLLENVQAAMEAVNWGGNAGMWTELQMEVLATDLSMSHAVDRFREHALPLATDAVYKLTSVERELLWLTYRIPESLADLHEFDAVERLAESVCADTLQKLWLESSYGSDR